MPVQYACALLMQHDEAMNHVVDYLRQQMQTLRLVQ